MVGGGGVGLVQLACHLWILALVALLASLMIGLFIRETLPAERRQPFHLRTTLGNFATLFRHERVLSYMLASGLASRECSHSLAPVPLSTSI